MFLEHNLEKMNLSELKIYANKIGMGKKKNINKKTLICYINTYLKNYKIKIEFNGINYYINKNLNNSICKVKYLNNNEYLINHIYEYKYRYYKFNDNIWYRYENNLRFLDKNEYLYNLRKNIIVINEYNLFLKFKILNNYIINDVIYYSIILYIKNIS